jgi:hypothetical protein
MERKSGLPAVHPGEIPKEDILPWREIDLVKQRLKRAIEVESEQEG